MLKLNRILLRGVTRLARFRRQTSQRKFREVDAVHLHFRNVPRRLRVLQKRKVLLRNDTHRFVLMVTYFLIRHVPQTRLCVLLCFAA